MGMSHDELCNTKSDPPLGKACENCELIAYVIVRERESELKRFEGALRHGVFGFNVDFANRKARAFLAGARWP